MMREAILEEFHHYIPELKKRLHVSYFLLVTYRYRLDFLYRMPQEKSVLRWISGRRSCGVHSWR
jgi:hypothetical protein